MALTTYGAFDFECWDWVNPYCCGIVWGPPGARKKVYVKDPTPNGERSLQTACLVLKSLLEIRQREGVRIWYAHNAAKYDALFLVNAADAMGWKVSGRMAGMTRAVTLEFSPNGGKGNSIVIRDSWQLAQSPLGHKELPCKGCCACDFELPSRKLFTADDYATDVRDWEPDRLKNGCLTDATLVMELIERIEAMILDYDGELRATFSSAAFSILEAAVTEETGQPLPSHANAQHANAASRKAYYGGRVEVFEHLPQGLLKEYDVTSAYPWAMTQTLPGELIAVAGGKTKLTEDILSGRHEGCLRVTVSVPKSLHIPPLPFIDSEDGIYFPTGKWEAWFTAPELRYALDLGCTLHRVHDGVAYEGHARFKGYIEKLFHLKANSVGAMRSFAKLCLNGTYGKLGQRPESNEIKLFKTEEAAYRFILKVTAEGTGSAGHLSKRGNRKALVFSREKWPRQTHFAAAAYVTALARMKLHRLLLQADLPAYCDTDSVHCRGGLDDLVSAELGGLKLEKEGFVGEYAAPKIYGLAWPDNSRPRVYRAKGFPCGEEAYRQLVAGDPVRVSRMQGLMSQLRVPGSPVRRYCDCANADGKCPHLHQSKAWAGVSRKRRPLADGSTVPWDVSELARGEHLEAKSPLSAESKRQLAEVVPLVAGQKEITGKPVKTQT